MHLKLILFFLFHQIHISMGFLKYVVYALLIIFAIALYMVYTAYMQIKNESEKEEKIDLEKTPYRRKHLLTKHEWQFYKKTEKLIWL